MLPIFDPLREITFLTVLARMLIAAACGTAIGLERSSKNRPAGFRTHILVCIGAAAASLTGHYTYLVMHLPADISRIGAQVITGLGFIGAGTIVVTKRQTIKGLTTAAGLWTAGIVGLAIGAGFIEGGLVTAIMILLIETVFFNIGTHIKHAPEFSVELGYHTKPALDHMMRCCKDRNIAITDLQITGMTDDEGAEYQAMVSLRPIAPIVYEDLLDQIRSIKGVVSAEVIEKSSGKKLPI